MNRLTYTLSLTASVLALAGCPGDDTSGTGTESNGSTGGDDDGSSMTVSPTTSATMTTTPSDDTMTPMDTGTDDGGCNPPCENGQMCIAGNCVGEPDTTGPLCDMWGENGSYGDCVAEGNGVCNGASCVSDNPQNPTAGACAQLGCTDVCDCPDPVDLEGTLVCDQLTSDMQNGCFFSCEGGDPCPTGMSCLGGFFCAWSLNAPPGPYGDCVNPPPGVACAEGICAVDADPPTLGACASQCMNASDCPDPPEGGAAPICGMFSNMMTYCVLPCDPMCPEGMECIGGQFCGWPVMEPVVPGFGDCVDPLPNDECLASETCFTDNAGNPTNGVCTATCTTTDDCPDPPTTGDAPVACGDLGGGDTCYLDCSGGATTCPDNMECIDDSYCAFPVLDPSVLDVEDFEGGAIPGTWSTINNDMLTVNPMLMLPFNDEAFIVVDDPDGSMAAAGTSYYMPAGMADDWLITPQLTLGASSILGFQARSSDPGFPDEYEVLISTGNPTMTDLMANAALLTVSPESGEYVAHQIDLAAAGYMNQDVYIAFHLTTNDGTMLLIDNVFVAD